MSVLKALHLKKTYKKRTVVSDVSLSVSRENRVCRVRLASAPAALPRRDYCKSKWP